MLRWVSCWIQSQLENWHFVLYHFIKTFSIRYVNNWPMLTSDGITEWSMFICVSFIFTSEFIQFYLFLTWQDEIKINEAFRIITLKKAMVGLFLISIGTGAIKPCVSSIGADQFDESTSGQKRQADFFTIFYASINAGSLISYFVSPILRMVED